MKYFGILLSFFAVSLWASETAYPVQRLNHSASVPAVHTDSEFDLDHKKMEIFHRLSDYHNTYELWTSILNAQDEDHAHVASDIQKLKKKCYKEIGYYDVIATQFLYAGALQKWVYFDPEKDEPLRWVKALPPHQVDTILERIGQRKEKPDIIQQYQDEIRNPDQETCTIQ